MSTITLNDLKAEHNKLAHMIAVFETQARAYFHLPEKKIELAPGEHYAGIIIGRDGEASHHVILLPDLPTDDLNFEAAGIWAKQTGGDLPTRREQSLLYANCKDQFSGEWYWSGKAHEDTRYAWAQYFGYGGRHLDTSYQFRARAVRRLVL